MLELNRLDIENPKVVPFPISKEVFRSNLHRAEYNGPVSGRMWKKVSALNSQYSDAFDWTVYDRLFEKFGDNQPRGGTIFKTNFKLANYHPECSKCHYALEIDTYGRGCIHNCVYCYAKDQLTLRGYWNRPHPMPVDLSEIRQIFYNVFETDNRSKWRSVLMKRVPLRIGSMSDSFMWMDQKYGVTLELLKILKFYRYPYVVFTRSDLIASDSYLKELNADLASIQFSISGDNEEITKKIEPGAPSIKRRLAALKKINEAGIWTAVRINPLFPTFPDGHYTDKESITQRFGTSATLKFSLMEIESCGNFLDRIAESKTKTLLAGFVRLNQTSISQLSKACGLDFKSFFKPENYKPNGESHFSDREIAYYYKTLQKNALERGLRFSTCYIGNGLKDYFQYQNMWSNKKDCCDIIGNVKGFNQSAQSIDWEERKKHAAIYKETAERAQLLEAKYENGEKTITKDTLGFSRIKWAKNDSSRDQHSVADK